AQLATRLSLGWKLSLLLWVVPAIIGIVVWVIFAKKNNQPKEKQLKFLGSFDQHIWRSPLAWQIALFMGLQSSLFYITVSWLPEILQNIGQDVNTAGWMLSYTQFIGLPIGFLIPVLAGRMKRQYSLVL